MRLIVPVLSISVIVLLGCTSSPTNTTPPPTSTTTPVPTATTPPTTTAPAAAPTITFTSPGNNVHQIGDVTITVQVTDFTVVDKLGERNVVGEGHLHYFLDVPAPTEPRDPAVTGPGTYVATAASTIVWHNVTGGSHTVYAELVNNDHTPLIPPVVASQQFLVIPEIGPLQIVIATPRDGAMVGGGDVTITAQTSNFNLVDKLGQTDVQREGHIHYFIDADTPTTPGQPAVSAPGSYAATAATSYTWKNVTAGQHTFSVELVNNDHTPLTPPVVAKITLNVTAPPTTAMPAPTTTTAPPPTTPPPTTTTTPPPTTTTTPPPTATTTPPPPVSYSLTAQNLSFDKSTMTVRSGASVTINFTNNDSGIPHNFSVYADSSATTVIFTGAMVTGPGTATYTFTAPSTPGNYYFRCDVHPGTMNGTFAVQ